MTPQAPAAAETAASPSTASEETDETRPDPGEPVGVVFGDVDADAFRVALRETGLGRGAWIAADHPECDAVLARVESVRRETGLSAREARDLEEAREDGEDQVTAEARVVGSARGSGDPPTTPVPAGAAVRRAPASLVAQALGLPDPQGPRPRGAYLGKVRGRDVDVVLDLEDVVRRHLSILAKTGAGKSYLVGVLLEELAKEGVPAVVVDPHGEHEGLARPNRDEEAFPRMRAFGVEPRQYAEGLRRFHPDPGADPEAEPLRLDAANLPQEELERFVGDLTNAQQGLLHEALRTLQDRPAHYTLEDVANQVRQADSSAKWNLLSNLDGLARRPLFEGEATDPGSLVNRGQVSLVNLRGVDPETADLAVARLASTLFEARKRGEVPPFLLVVEEAHRFCPERGFDASVASQPLRTVASEGRKFGMGLAIVSQRPAKVDKNVLSQCNTEVALKVTNPRDVKALASSLEGITEGVAEEIQRLPVGQAVVSHPDLRTPVITEVRPRETRPGGDRTPVVADDPPEAASDAPAPDPDAFPAEPAGPADPNDPAAGPPEAVPDADEADPEPASEPPSEAGEAPGDGEPAPHDGDAPREADGPPEDREAPGDDEPGLDDVDPPRDVPELEAGPDADPDPVDEVEPGDPGSPDDPSDLPHEGPAPDETAPETVLDEAAPDAHEPDTPAADEEGDPEAKLEDGPNGPDPEIPNEADEAPTDPDPDPASAEAGDDEAEVDAVLQVDPPASPHDDDDADDEPEETAPEGAPETGPGTERDDEETDTMEPLTTTAAEPDHATDPAADGPPDHVDRVLEETAADPPEDPDEADLDAGTASLAGEPERTVGAVEEAEAILADVDPRDLETERLRTLVDEVEDLLTRLGRVGGRTPDVVEAHNGLAAQLVRVRRVLSAREADEPTSGLLRR